MNPVGYVTKSSLADFTAPLAIGPQTSTIYRPGFQPYQESMVPLFERPQRLSDERVSEIVQRVFGVYGSKAHALDLRRIEQALFEEWGVA